MKKWSYVTAMMLAVSTGCVFTGCINNDEPYGIEQIRLATAKFLESKKAATEAEASASAIAAETEKIKQETEKIKQEVEKIKAEAAAEAAKLEAEAAAAKTQAEADLLKAKAEAIIALAKAQAEKISAAAYDMIADANIKLNESAQDLEQAKYWFEQEKIKNAEQVNDALYQAVESAFANYIEMIGYLNYANAALIQAQNDYNDAMFDLKWENGEWVSDRYAQEAKIYENLKLAQKGVDQTTADIQKFNDLLAEYQGKQPAELQALLDEYLSQLEEVENALVDAEVEKKALYLNNQDLYESEGSIQKEIDKIKNEDVLIEPLTIEPTQALKDVFGMEEPWEIVGKNVYYNLGEKKDVYNEYLNRFTKTINGLNRYLLDANDVAWTNARVAEMQRHLDNITKEGGAFYLKNKAWEAAKKVYNDGGVPDLTDLVKSKDIQDAIDAFAASKAGIDTAKEKYEAAKLVVEEADKKVNEESEKYYGNEETAGTNAWEVYQAAEDKYNKAVAAADKKLSDVEEAARAAVEDIYEQENKETTEKYRDYMRALEAYELAEKQLTENTDPTLKESLQKAVDAADKAVQEASKAVAGVSEKYQDKLAAADKAGQASIRKAQNENLAEKQAAEKEWQKAQDTFAAAGYGQEDKDPAYAPVQAALDAQTAANEAKDAAYAEIEAAFNASYELYGNIMNPIEEQMESINYYWSFLEQCYYFAGDALFNYAFDNGTEFPVITVPALYQNNESVYINAKEYLIDKSQAAYGMLGLYWDSNKFNGSNIHFDFDEAFLVDKVTVEMANAYVKAYVEKNYQREISDVDCVWYYKQLFNGANNGYGEVIYLENRIKVANAMLTNSTAFDGVIEKVQTALDALKASEKAVDEQVADLTFKKNQVADQIKALEEPITDKIQLLEHEQGVLMEIEMYLKSVIATQDQSGFIREIEKKIKTLEVKLETQQALLEKAEYQKEQYEQGYYNVWKESYELSLQMAEADVALAQEAVDFYKARYEELQKRYESASQKNDAL